MDLGELMFSLCYLCTAGKLTLMVLKCENLKAVDITGSSDPYVKVSLLCDGWRLKKKKTTIQKNMLNPVSNKAIIFDIPLENMDQVSLISVMDYDRVDHSEIMGVFHMGINIEGLDRDHGNGCIPVEACHTLALLGKGKLVVIIVFTWMLEAGRLLPELEQNSKKLTKNQESVRAELPALTARARVPL